MPLNVKIIDPSGKGHNFQLPENIEIERLLPRIVQSIKLTGQPSEYTLFHSSKALDNSLSLGLAEVIDGAELQLKFQATPTGAKKDYYVAEANARWPALIIYLLDISGSMGQPLGEHTRIQVVENTLQLALKTMVRRSLRGSIVSPRYRIAMFTYSDKVHDVYKGIKTIDQVVNIGIPEIKATYTTNTAGAFAKAKELLEKELPNLQAGTPGSKDGTYPAPLVCHLTDGEYTQEHGDPGPIAKEIMSMSVPDGHVLVENIYISDTLVGSPVDSKTWDGFTRDTEFANNSYANKLLSMSSTAPASYCAVMSKSGYEVSPDSVMLYPGTSYSLVEMAFQMSCATPTGEG